MSKSEIFDSYIKIAEEQGLISLSEDDNLPEKPKESAKLKRYKKSPYPRAGSDDISTIEALYGTKGNNSIEYENNIMEAAHKTPVVIAPAYDRLNALVENNIERQNIMSNIALKPGNGNITQHRYASNNLLMELIRVANDMDNRGKEEIRVLADSIISELNEKKKFKTAGFEDWLKETGGDLLEVGKGAGTGAAIGGIAGGILGAIFGEGIGAIPGAKVGALAGAALGGIISSLTKTAPQVKNISINSKNLSAQLEDFKKAFPYGNPERVFIQSFQDNLAILGSASEQYNLIIGELQNNRESTAEDAAKSHTAATNLLTYINNINKFIDKFNDKVNRKVYEEFVGHSKILTPVYQFMDDDIQDVQKSISSLKIAINNFMESLSAVKTDASSATQQEPTKAEKIEQTSPDEDELIDDSEEESSPPEKPTTSASSKAGDYSDLEELLGHKLTDKEVEFFKSLE